MADMDVDAYNRRGEQYYASPVDTIGTYVENGEDFVYTQQIQKYYNPTIVVDNADVLGDVLENAYGNVEIVIDNNGLLVFSPYYGWNYPYYAGWWSSPSWGLSINPWGWSIGFTILGIPGAGCHHMLGAGVPVGAGGRAGAGAVMSGSSGRTSPWQITVLMETGRSARIQDGRTALARAGR